MMKEIFAIIISILFVAVVFMSGCTDQQNQTSGPPSSFQFTAPTQLPDATVGEPYVYSFCNPDRTDENDLCGSSVNPCDNPSGGNEPYHFQLDSGSGFPPFGLTLFPNGLLMGTPTIAGERIFTVCAVDQGEHQCCVQTSLNVIEPAITVNPDSLIVQGRICFNDPCEVSATVVVSSTVSWNIDYATGSGTGRCFDTVAEFSRYWSVCPNSGGPGETTVTISTMMYGESTPSYYEEPILDRGSTIRFQDVDDSSSYADLSVGLELPYYS
ncbi:MAG: hypothetical protein NT038_06240 [Euryarchaeota archaeon]|nr:hypothetical protein [Euryarchaeota archaeon]